MAFLVEGGVSTVAALASATALAAAACGLGDRKGRLRAGYDADLIVVDGDPVADIGALARPVAVFAGGRRPAGTAMTDQPGRRDGPGAAGRPRGSAGLTTATPYTRHAATVP